MPTPRIFRERITAESALWAHSRGRRASRTRCLPCGCRISDTRSIDWFEFERMGENAPRALMTRNSGYSERGVALVARNEVTSWGIRQSWARDGERMKSAIAQLRIQPSVEIYTGIPFCILVANGIRANGGLRSWINHGAYLNLTLPGKKHPGLTRAHPDSCK